MINRHIRILGTRGVPAAHGGFETFAEHLGLYLVGQGWQVTVYCQEEASGPIHEDTWRGVRRVRVPVSTPGAAGTIIFDWKSTLHAAGEQGTILTLGYNTALFCAVYRISKLTNIINMDGIEWRRGKWGKIARLWFWLNDWAGCLFGNHLVADHPVIKEHLATRVSKSKITTIAYGAETVKDANSLITARYGVFPGQYAIVIARAEMENSILEIVRAWSRRRRGIRLLVLGKYLESHPYQKEVIDCASDEVLFPGAIYDKETVQALRYHALFYIHGHQVGGTNPSLVEALGAGNAVLAHDNPYNRWVAGEGGLYFNSEDTCACRIEELLASATLRQSLQQASISRHAAEFTWTKILSAYERLLEQHAGVAKDQGVGECLRKRTI